MMWFTFAIMIIAGVADIYLMATKRDTISKRYHRLFPQWFDLIIMIAILATVWVDLGVFVFTCVMAGTILGHLAWHGDN
ncbi:hypothetical protein LCGC14_1933740 [marine sediment metagenome]|uniref:Uncharacterized protein n=1 Tax=marine sediment metagenome TaxID=412755 RepID=A0A0F9I0Y8_9ZZZZ